MSRKLVTPTGRRIARERPRSLDPLWLLGVGGLAMMLEGCRLVGDIFRAGVLVGVLGIILFVALVFGVIRLFTS
jgi:hypothetical protein